MDLFTQPFFLQTARLAGNYIILQYGLDDPVIYDVTSNGEILVKSTKNGKVVFSRYQKEIYSISVQADANTDIYLYGDVTMVYFGQENYNIKSIVAYCDTLNMVNAATASTFFTKCDLTGSINVGNLIIGKMPNLAQLYIGECTKLNGIPVDSETTYSQIQDIICPANTEATAKSIASLINGTTDGTDRLVIVVGEETYADVIKEAATAKGWAYRHATKPIH